MTDAPPASWPFTQPLGTLPWPAGLLVLPDTLGAAEVAVLLCRGETPLEWPPALAFVAAALDEDTERAAGLVPGADPLADYNRAVLIGDEEQWAAVAQRCAADATVSALTATARYSLGLQEALPPVDGLPGEVAALVLSARSSQCLERGDVSEAVEHLQVAVEAAATAGSPLLATSLAATQAELLRETGNAPAAVERAGSALALLAALPATATVDERRADLQLTRALARSELADSQPWLLRDVVKDLQDALTVFTEDAYPERFAECSQHLALAFLVMPLSSQGDRIRTGVAVNALRGALRVYDRSSHPVAWASATLNLANALQYLPSALPEQHLTEAVDLYEQVLQTRDERTDPIGVARTLANQANALAHLGAFVDAGERLDRAEALFRGVGDDEGLVQVAEIRQEMAQRSSSTARGA